MTNFLELSSLGVTAIPILPSNLCLDLLSCAMARIVEPTESPNVLAEEWPAGPATALCAALWPSMRSKRVHIDVVVVEGPDAEASPAVGQTASEIKDTFSPPNSLGRLGMSSS